MMTILYVADQQRSTEFYQQLLQQEPVLNVPGMTEFALFDNHSFKLGLMPERGITKLLHDPKHPGKFPDLTKVTDKSPRVELYLVLLNAHLYYEHAIELGATAISPIQLRNWGDYVAYASDPDGHILAFAEAAMGNGQ
ncbi:MAG: lactoylglutathione lyase [bacterium]|nr:lactoylglutathione lyase [bacterium]